ncbi:hypothetical protein ACFX2I_041873 [Malus domestica]
MKESFKGDILPAIHPDSVRVRLIAKDIIEALQRGLSHEVTWTDVDYASGKVEPAHEGGGNDTLMALHDSPEQVDRPVVNAFCLPGGKIVVFTGLLKHFRRTIIGHCLVGHAVARHSAETITKNLWFAILQLSVSNCVGEVEQGYGDSALCTQRLSFIPSIRE